MSVASEITRLQNAKAALKTSIENKGVTVSSSAKLDTYPALVDSIQTGGGGSSSDEWLYYSATGVKVIQSGFMDTFLDCSNTSNLTVERIVSDGSLSYHYGTWWADWQISDEPFASSYVDAWFRIKPNNMSVGDTGTLTINLLNRTCIITFKLTETFSEEQMYYQGTDIQKLEIVSAPYIVNPLNGDFLGTSTSVGAVTHQYQISGGTISECYIACTSLSTYGGGSGFYNNASWNTPWLKELFGSSTSVTISDQGLITYNFNRTQSHVNEYNWLVGNYINVIIKLDNGLSLIDHFHTYNHYSCFIKDTNIILANKTNKKIQNITYDDELLVWNFDEGKYDSAKPLWIKKVQTTTWYYKLTFSNGMVLKVTGDYPKAHSLYSVDDGKFIHANELVGKKVYTLNGIQTLEKCEEMHEEVEFYNIITDYHMNLFAEGILTSTSLNNLYPIEKMTFIKEDREPVFDTSIFEDKWIKGLRLNEQPNDVTDYVNNVIKLNNNTI